MKGNNIYFGGYRRHVVRTCLYGCFSDNRKKIVLLIQNVCSAQRQRASDRRPVLAMGICLHARVALCLAASCCSSWLLFVSRGAYFVVSRKCARCKLFALVTAPPAGDAGCCLWRRSRGDRGPRAKTRMTTVDPHRARQGLRLRGLAQ